MEGSGITIFNFCGGEPLLRKDLEEIATYAKVKGMITGVNTNGTLLTPQRAETIAEAFDFVYVSIDGFEKTHDTIRGLEGTFERAITGLKNLIEVRGDCTVGVNFVLTNKNYEEFLPICSWLKDLGVDVLFVSTVGESIDGGNFASIYSIPKDKVDGFIKKVLNEKMKDPKFLISSEKFIKLIPKFVKGEMPHICDAGRLYLGIDNVGNLFICPGVSPSSKWRIGSLLNSSAEELLRSRCFEGVLKSTKDCKPCLLGCTVSHSLLFRSSFVGLLKEGFRYWKASRCMK